MTDGLTSEQKTQYHHDGYTILPGFLNAEACDAFVERMMNLHSGRACLNGYPPRAQDDWGRTFNQHFYDAQAMELLLHPRLRQPLSDCLGGEVDGVQTMYFYEGSEQRRHQDAYYLPQCMAAWIAMVDVSSYNGTILVQTGSHRGHLITAAELKHSHGQDFSIGARYNGAVDELFERNRLELGLEEVPVNVRKGDVVLFHGVLIHRGGPIEQPGALRHVMANHYIPYAFDGWPYGEWPRYSFDGEKRVDTHDPTVGHPSRVTRPT